MANGKNYRYGGGYGNRGYSQAALIAGARAMVGTPVDAGGRLRAGYATRNPRMAEKIAAQKLDLLQTEKQISEDIAKVNWDPDPNKVNAEHLPMITGHLSGMKEEYFRLIQQRAGSDDPTEKAEALAEMNKLEKTVEKTYGDMLKIDQHTQLWGSDQSSYSFHNQEERLLFAKYVDPNAERSIDENGNVVIQPEGEDALTTDEVLKMFPTIKESEGITNINTSIKQAIANKVQTGAVPTNEEIRDNLVGLINSAQLKNPEANKEDILRSIMHDGEFSHINPFAESAQYETLQDAWKGMGNDGLWINADGPEYEKLKNTILETHQTDIGSMEDVFVDYMTTQISRHLEGVDYVESLETQKKKAELAGIKARTAKTNAEKDLLNQKYNKDADYTLGQFIEAGLGTGNQPINIAKLDYLFGALPGDKGTISAKVAPRVSSEGQKASTSENLVKGDVITISFTHETKDTTKTKSGTPEISSVTTLREPITITYDGSPTRFRTLLRAHFDEFDPEEDMLTPQIDKLANELGLNVSEN